MHTHVAVAYWDFGGWFYNDFQDKNKINIPTNIVSRITQNILQSV